MYHTERVVGGVYEGGVGSGGGSKLWSKKRKVKKRRYSQGSNLVENGIIAIEPGIGTTSNGGNEEKGKRGCVALGPYGPSVASHSGRSWFWPTSFRVRKEVRALRVRASPTVGMEKKVLNKNEEKSYESHHERGSNHGDLKECGKVRSLAITLKD